MTLINPVEFKQISINATDEVSNNTLNVKEKPREYQSGMSLAPLQSVYYAGQIYSATKQISTLSTTPDKSEDMTLMGSANSTAYLDDEIHTQSINSGDLIIELDLGGNMADTLALLNISASKILIQAGESTLYDKTNIQRNISGWLDFFTAPFSKGKKDINVNLGMQNHRIKITLTPTNSHAGLGKLIIGKSLELGALLYEARVGEIDYSRRNIDMYGKTHIRQGKSAKYLSGIIVIDTNRVDTIMSYLSEARGQFRTFIGDERDNGISALTIHGYIKDYEINIIDEQNSELVLNLDGVI